MANSFLKTVEFSKTDFDLLLNFPIPESPNAEFVRAGIAFEFFKNSNHTAENPSIEYTRIVATRAYWKQKIEGGDDIGIDNFTRISPANVEGRPFSLLNDTPPEFANIEPFEYVFFDDETIKKLAYYDPEKDPNDENKGFGICLIRTVVTIETSGVFKKYQSLIAFPNHTGHSPLNAQTVQDEMAYSIGISCPPYWDPRK